MTKAVIAIVGRPNVGKSSLFNALAGERISIVHDSPGVTRDRITTEAEWFGRSFTLIDTGGLEVRSSDPLLRQMERQVKFAVESADLILFLCDAVDGLTAQDREIADLLRRSGRPVVLAVNKCDNPSREAHTWEFFELGLGELVSALLELLPEESESAAEEERIRVAIIGKPNVGKSSLINRLLNKERSIVSDIAGTTRDALDVNLDNEWGSYCFIDTAGLRKRARVEGSVEKYSIIRTEEAIERSDVCLILLDAEAGITEQDTKVAGRAHEAGKASIFVLNKWDLVDKTTDSFSKKEKEIQERFAFMRYAPVISISALSGQRVPALFELINRVYAAGHKRLSTGVVNEVLAESLALHRPPSDKGRALKIFYVTQVSAAPPTLVFFINDKDLLHFSYERYLENRFREAFGFEGNPLRMIWRPRTASDYIRVGEKEE